MKGQTRTSLIDYPDTFPQPLQGGYSVTQDHGVVTTVMESGWTRRRRLSPYTYRSGTLVFRIDVQSFAEWHRWVHANGFKWMDMRIQDDRGLPTVAPRTAARTIRFTGAASFSYGDWDVVTVSVPCEFLTDQTEPAP